MINQGEKGQVWNQQMKFLKQPSLKYKQFFSLYGLVCKNKNK